MSKERSIYSNMTWTILGQGLTFVLSFLSSTILARTLGPSGRGIYALVISSGLLLADIGAATALTTTLVYSTGKALASISTLTTHAIIFVSLSFALLASALYFLPASWFESIFGGLSAQYIPVILLYALQQLLLIGIVNGILFGTNRVRFSVMILVGNALIVFLAQVLLLIVMQLGIYGAFLQISLLIAWNLCLVSFVLIRHFKPRLVFDINILKGIFAYAMKLYPAYIGSMLQARVDIFYVAMFQPTSMVGIYAIGRGLAEIISLIEPPVTQALSPYVVSKGKEEAGYIAARGFALVLWITGSIACVGAIFSPIIPLIFGADYQASIGIFLLTLPGVVGLSTRSLLNYFSIQMGKPEISTGIMLGAGLLSIPAFYFFTAWWGYTGTAMAYSLLAILRGLLTIILFLRLSRQNLSTLVLLKRSDFVQLKTLIRSRFIRI